MQPTDTKEIREPMVRVRMAYTGESRLARLSEANQLEDEKLATIEHATTMAAPVGLIRSA